MSDDCTTSRSPVDEPHDPSDRWRTSLLMPVVIIAIAVGLIAAIVVVAQQQQDEGGAVLAASTVDPGTLPVTVPYRDVAGAIVIDVTLRQGSRTVPMILDSGAPTIVSEELAEVFAGGTAGTIATSTADGQFLTSNVVTLPRLAIGDAVFQRRGCGGGQHRTGQSVLLPERRRLHRRQPHALGGVADRPVDPHADHRCIGRRPRSHRRGDGARVHAGVGRLALTPGRAAGRGGEPDVPPRYRLRRLAGDAPCRPGGLSAS